MQHEVVPLLHMPITLSIICPLTFTSEHYTGLIEHRMINIPRSAQ